MARMKLEGVGVAYPVYNAASQSLRNQLVSISTGGRVQSARGHVTTVQALEDINLDLKDGDRIGLVGHNGSGKTTLLRTMAGIFRPTKGRMTVDGRVSTVFGLGAGMDPELTGYENITRMAMLLGASRKEAEASVPGIEDFTELGQFLAMPVRTYSAGMTTRLLFAVATAVHPEILLVDEVLGAGDEAFQEKARQRMSEFVAKASIFVLASHSPELMKQFCTRMIRLEHGRIVSDEPIVPDPPKEEAAAAAGPVKEKTA
jgi:ABC-type polysaccharide/polyol phosphate transport system ATPase subunit